MRTVMLLILAMAALAAAPALAGETPTTATVDILLTISPYAEVFLHREIVKVRLPKYGGTKVLEIGGAIVTNCPVMLSAAIQKPEGAPGNWYVTVLVPEITELGFHEFEELMRVEILDIPPKDKEEKPIFYDLELVGSKLGEFPTPQAGQLVVTVMMLP